jgi:hypothetical protein
MAALAVVAAAAHAQGCAGMAADPLSSLNDFRPFPASNAWNIDLSAAPVDPDDRHVPVLEKDGCWLYELGNARLSKAGVWSAGAAAVVKEQRPYTWTVGPMPRDFPYSRDSPL